MPYSITKQSTDHSSTDNFSFSFFCDLCGKEWISPAVPFAAGNFTAIKHTEARELIWAEEHRTAFTQANLEAHVHFNHCPQCGRWVCDDCFTAAAGEPGELCRECSALDGNKGKNP